MGCVGFWDDSYRDDKSFEPGDKTTSRNRIQGKWPLKGLDVKIVECIKISAVGGAVKISVAKKTCRGDLQYFKSDFKYIFFF